MNREGCIPPAQGGAPKTGGGPGGAPQVIAGLAPGMHGQRAGYVCVGASATVRAWPLTYTDTPDMVDCGPRRARARRRRRSDTPDMVDHGRHGTCTSLVRDRLRHPPRLRHPWDDGRVTRWRVCPIWPCAHIVRSSHYPRSYRAISADTVPFPHESPSAYPPGVYAATFPQPSACAVRDDPPISPTFPSLQPNHNLSARPVSVDTPPFPSIPACHAPTGSLFFPHQPTTTAARTGRKRATNRTNGTGTTIREDRPRPGQRHQQPPPARPKGGPARERPSTATSNTTRAACLPCGCNRRRGLTSDRTTRRKSVNGPYRISATGVRTNRNEAASTKPRKHDRRLSVGSRIYFHGGGSGSGDTRVRSWE